MAPRSQTFLRLARALLACLVVLLAFEAPAPRIEIEVPVAAAVARAPARGPAVRPQDAPRVPSELPLATAHAERIVRNDVAPREPLVAVRRLYVELCSLLC